MRTYFRTRQASLTLLWFGYLLLAIFALIFEAEAKKHSVFLPQDFHQYKSISAREVHLPDGSTAWLHGISKGSLVTIAGNKATAGLYSSKDGAVAFTVDEGGNLSAPVTDITPVENFDIAALISSEQEEDEILKKFN